MSRDFNCGSDSAPPNTSVVSIFNRNEIKEETMKRHVAGVSAACMAVCMSIAVAHAQQNEFPLAARAGVDSKAREVAPSGAVNQGPFDMTAWKYGNAFTPPPGAKIKSN